MTLQHSNFPGVSIVIPSYNGQPLLERFLPSVVATARHYVEQRQAPTELIVVDDGSSDHTVEWLTKHYPMVRCLAQPKNRGFSPACNTGFRAARYPIIWLLNNDIETTPTTLLPLVENFFDPKVFAVSCHAYRLNDRFEPTTEIDGAGRVAEIVRGFWKVYRSYDLLPNYDRKQHPPLYTMMASGGYVAFDSEKLKTLGGFEEILAPFYWEDAELCYRAWKCGWTVLYEPESLVYHRSSATIAEQFDQKVVNVIATRNRLMMHWIHLHDWRWWLMHLGMTFFLLMGNVLTGRFHYCRAWSQVWKHRKDLFDRRSAAQQTAVLNDRQVISLINEVISRPGVVTYKNAREYAQLQQLQKQGDT